MGNHGVLYTGGSLAVSELRSSLLGQAAVADKVHNLNRNHTLNLSCFRNIKAED